MRAPTDRARLARFLVALGTAIRRPIRLYLVGGSVMVDLGLREATLDIGYVAHADDPDTLDELYRVLPSLKESLKVNVEWASPAVFLPIPAEAALGRAQYVRQYGPVAVYHYDYASLALAKIARAAERDLADVETLVREKLVAWADVERLWAEVRERPWGRLPSSPAQVERHMELTRRRLR